MGTGRKEADVQAYLYMTRKEVHSLLENPPVFKVDKGNEHEKKKIQSRLENRQNSAKQELLSDPTNLFIVDTESNRIHDRTCAVGKALPYEKFRMVKEYDNSFKKCSECSFKAAVRSLLVNQDEHQEVLKILHKTEIELQHLLMLIQHGAKIKFITYKLLELHRGEERWRLEKSGRGSFTLYHNSYVIINGTREFTGEFHVQRLRGGHSADNIIREIIGYNSDFHVQKALAIEAALYKKALEIAPDNDILRPEPLGNIFRKPIALRVKNKGILFDYYYCMDCAEGCLAEVFKKKKILYKILSDAKGSETAYRLVYCKIPKWSRKKMSVVFNYLKKEMFGYHHFDGYIGIQTVMKHLDALEIGYEAGI